MLLKKQEYHKNSDLEDDQLFIDFNLIKYCHDFDSTQALLRIDDYMRYNLVEYRRGNKLKVANNFSEFKEKSYFPTLGFSRSSHGGRGVASNKFIEILDLIFKRDCASKLMEGNIFSPTFVENYNKDRNTDFLLTLMLPELSEYTKKVAYTLELDTREVDARLWDFSSHEWVDCTLTLAKFPKDSLFRIIVPEEFLTPELPYSGSNFIFTYWIKILNASRKKQGLDIFTIPSLREYIKDNYNSNHNYLMHVLSEMNDQQLINYIGGFSNSAKTHRDKNKKGH